MPLEFEVETIIMAAITMAACYITYKKGKRDGISQTVDWFEYHGYISFNSDSD